MQFKSTLRAETNDPIEIQKADNDLLDKINQLAKAVDALATPAENTGFTSGDLKMWPSSTAPTGWLNCDGSAVSRTANKALFAVIGTTFGAGDGSTTFNLPDFREASPYGIGTRSAGVTAHDPLTIGTFADDQTQGHLHLSFGDSGLFRVTSGSSSSGYVGATSAGLAPTTGNPTTDGTNGTPRTGTTTRGKILGINFIIKK
jgi:microcystin-dependent protein